MSGERAVRVAADNIETGSNLGFDGAVTNPASNKGALFYEVGGGTVDTVAVNGEVAFGLVVGDRGGGRSGVRGHKIGRVGGDERFGEEGKVETAEARRVRRKVGDHVVRVREGRPGEPSVLAKTGEVVDATVDLNGGTVDERTTTGDLRETDTH